MQEEPAEELVGLESHGPTLLSMGVVSPTKPPSLGIELEQAGRLRRDVTSCGLKPRSIP